MNALKAKNIIREMGPLIGLILLFLVIAVLNDSFVEPSNLRNLLRQVSINALISFGMTFVILTGGIDLSVGSILALSSALMASFIVKGMNPEVAIFTAVIIGTFLGAVNGIVIAYGKVAPFIATLATMTIYRGLTLVYTNGNPISGLSDDPIFTGFGQGYMAGIPVPAVIMLITFFILFFILRKTPLGRQTYAVGGNEKVSYIAGIKINMVKIFAYAITGCLCAVAGAILTSRLNSAQPTAGLGYELDAIAAVVLGGTSLAGGKGRIVGSLIGALIIGTLNNGLNILNVSSFYQQVVKGIVILLAVLMDRKKS
ncbi:MAG TPA: ribose ABC transporter permease [Veillonellaceae bacterium]|jgi:ribose transport system permease protein|nr:ribose ABC transporter permease [Veillonellaceae bacterium]